MLVEQLYAKGYKGEIDFVYVPIDFKNINNSNIIIFIFRIIMQVPLDAEFLQPFVKAFELSLEVAEGTMR